MSKTLKRGARVSSPDIELFRRPGFLVRRLHQIYVAIYLQNCERFGTTPVQSSVMQVLFARPGIDQVALAAAIGIDRTTASAVISRLERRRILKRTKDPIDRRVRRAYLTARGRSLLAKMEYSIQAAHRQLLRPLPRRQREVFVDRLFYLVQANNDQGRSTLKIS